MTEPARDQAPPPTAEASIAPEVESLLRDPGTYPGAVDSVAVEATHISKVFLTGRRVYKVKKPVDLGFLDATTLEKRRRLCEREVALNQRLSDGVYHGVVPVTRGDGGLELGGEGRAVEYTVEMRQLPKERTMEHLLESGALDVAMVRQLAERLAAFHARAGGGDLVARFGSVETVTGNTRENFEQIAPFLGRVLRTEFYERMRETVEEFLQRRRGLFEARVEAGRIRDGHGDLKLDHVYFTDDGLQVIDCIEFNERFRNGDVASDLAFLATELEFRRHPEPARELLRHYARASGDAGIYSVLDFYRNYRALVRTKVECFRLDAGDLGVEQERERRASAERYLELAHRYARVLGRPTAWVVCGPVATGKTALARELGGRLQLEVHHSDALRKELFGIPPDAPAVASYGEGIYAPEATERTYRALRERAGKSLARRRSLILDATYSRRRQRRELADAARRLGASVVFLECRAPRETLRSRLRAREGSGGMSDARPEHLERMLERFEPLDELDASFRAAVSSEGTLLESLVDALAEGQLRRERQAVESAG